MNKLTSERIVFILVIISLALTVIHLKWCNEESFENNNPNVTVLN